MRSIEEGGIRIENERDKLKLLLQEVEDNYDEWPISNKESTQTQLSWLVNSLIPCCLIHPCSHTEVILQSQEVRKYQVPPEVTLAFLRW